MEDLMTLEKAIHHLKQEMSRLYEEKGSFVDESVMAISQELDVYLVQFQLMKKQKGRQC